MRKKTTAIEKALIKELKKIGIEYRTRPRFIKDLIYSFQTDPLITLSDVNERLQLLGWEGVELDYHTLQLAIASFEREQSKSLA
jgi:hypothetical protein